MNGEKRGPLGKRRRRKLRKEFVIFVAAAAVIVIGVVVGLVFLLNFLVGSGDKEPDDGQIEIPIETLPPPPTEPPDLRLQIPNPQAVDGTRPSDFGLETTMLLNDEQIVTYTRQDRIDFGNTNQYSNIEGILTFRGNNFRDTASYGSLGSSIAGELSIVWQNDLPEVIEPDNPNRNWSGMGWTGQPLVAKWSPEARENMNLYPEKRDKTDLKEVIFGTLGGAIYFLDLEDGRQTRETIEERWPFRGAGALDPRGYPLFYVGAGSPSEAGPGSNLIYSLADSSELFDYGENDSFRRRNWQAFGGSTIVHAETDSITYASESNVIYQFTLNSRHSTDTGTTSIAPSEMFRWRYSTTRLREVYGQSMTVSDSFSPQYGFQSSPAFWREYMYIADNAGNLFCINVNTFEVIWMSELYDDTDASPVIELDEMNGRAYIYIGNSALFNRNRNTNIATVRFFKIDAITGEKVWASEGRRCINLNGMGGIRGTAALGKNSLRDLVFVPYANVVNDNGFSRGSFLVAYNKITGEEVWSANFGGPCMSSPVDVYDDSGNGYIVFATASFTNNEGERVGGFVHLVDGRTGERISSVQLQGHIEASPVVYDNMIVIGTLNQMIYGVKIT